MFEKTLILFTFAVGIRIKMNKCLKRRIDWDTKNSWVCEKYIITLKIWRKKTQALSLNLKNETRNYSQKK